MKILRKIVCNSKHTNFTNTFDFCIDGERNYEGIHYYVVRDINGKYFEIEDVTELSKQTGYRVELMDDSTLWIAAPEHDKRYLARKLSLLSTDSILSSAIDSSTTKSVNSATDLSSLQQIQSELNEKLYEVMTELPFGFSPEEVDEYSVVEVTEDQNMIKAEVRAELNYDEMFELCEFLNPVVQKYDTNTYFEPVEPGIIEAYMQVN